MTPHSSALAWNIPWTEEPGRLQSMASLRARHDWATSLSLFTFMHWRKKWQLTLVFVPGEQGTGEPGGLPSMGSHRVRHNWSDLAAAAVHDLYAENYKTLLRESIMPLINKDAMFTDQKTQYFYNIKSFPIDLWIRYNPYQNTSRTFYFTSWL